MTQRDRLIEYLHSAPLEYGKKRKTDTRMFVEFYADYLLENGVICPPCKVGDTVYCITTFFPNSPVINKCEVDSLHITSGKNILGHKKPSHALVRNTHMYSLSTRIYFEEFGKTVFFTREEAEKALSEHIK